MASHESGLLAIGLAEGGIYLRGGGQDRVVKQLGDRPVVAATAGFFESAESLLICLGSQQFAPDCWKYDLMSNKATGSVWRLNLNSLKAECLSDAMAYPYGIVTGGDGGVIVSESWRHQLVKVGQDGRPVTLYGDLPGYPSRLVGDADGKDFWLCVFAPRLQLIEFVLREDEYRRRMMSEIDPDYWIAPSLYAARSFLEPLQGGAVKQLGELKPWAPTRSYGLIVRLDLNGQPVESLHSRANGTRHGITSCLPQENAVLVASRGGDTIVAVER
jgi:hypothetical protein